MEIPSLNSHFPHQKPQHRMLRRKKTEPVTPHFLSLNQDIVAGSQKRKCGLKYVMFSMPEKPKKLLAPSNCSEWLCLFFQYICEMMPQVT